MCGYHMEQGTQGDSKALSMLMGGASLWEAALLLFLTRTTLSADGCLSQRLQTIQ